MNPGLCDVSKQLQADFGDGFIRKFNFVQFILYCPVISFSSVGLKMLLLPVSIYVFMR